MKLSDEVINREVERYRKHLVESNREPSHAEIEADRKAEEQRLNHTAAWMGLRTEQGRKIFAEGAGAFDPGFNAANIKLREVA